MLKIPSAGETEQRQAGPRSFLGSMFIETGISRSTERHCFKKKKDEEVIQTTPPAFTHTHALYAYHNKIK